jgi:hypothetical protein
MTKVAFPLLGLFRQNVALVSMLPPDLTGTRDGKPLLGTGFRFCFRHYLNY